MFHIVTRTGEEVVDAQHIAAFREEPFAQVGTQEAGAAGYEHALFQGVAFHLIRRRGRVRASILNI